MSDYLSAARRALSSIQDARRDLQFISDEGSPIFNEAVDLMAGELIDLEARLSQHIRVEDPE